VSNDLTQQKTTSQAPTVSGSSVAGDAPECHPLPLEGTEVVSATDEVDVDTGLCESCADVAPGAVDGDSHRDHHSPPAPFEFTPFPSDCSARQYRLLHE
jgi:hypothetical protein